MSFQRTSEIAGGGLAYNPGSTYFPLTDYMSKSGYTHAANVHTVFGIIQAEPFVLATQTYRSVFRSVHSGNTIGSLNLQATDAATAPAGGQMFGRDSAGGVMFDIRCSDVLVDGNKHWFFFAYNAATADYIFIVDGKDATIVAETANTGTQSSGASAAFGIGSNDAGTASVDYQGEISFFGYDDSYRENWYDFFESDGTPKEIDTAGWTEWGAQPLIFSPHADMRNNLGSLTAFAINGTGMRAGDMMNNAIPYRGLATIGDATLRDIADGKYAWVNGQQIRGYGVPHPTDISGCVICLDALYPGNTVDQWDDLSGNGNHATKRSGQTMPTIGSGVCAWNGTSDECDLPDLSSLTAGEIFILQRRYADNGDTGVNTGWMSFGTRTDSFQDHFTYSSTIYAGFGRGTRVTVGNPTQATNAWHLIHMISAPSLWQFYFNEERMYNTASNTVAFRSTPVIGGAGLGVFFQGEWKGMVLFNRVLTGLERAQVRGWLASL